MRPYGLAPAIALLAGKNEPLPVMVVLLLPAKSDEPPQNSGRTVESALIIFPEAARVAISLPLSNVGNTFSQSFGSSPATNRLRSAARSGLDFSHSKN